MMAVSQTVYAIRIAHEDRSALRPTTHYVSHALAIFGVGTLSRAARNAVLLLIGLRADIVQIGEAGPQTGQFPAAKQVGHSFHSVGHIEAFVVVRTLKFETWSEALHAR